MFGRRSVWLRICRTKRVFRHFDQVQNAAGEALAQVAMAKADDARPSEFVVEERQDRLAIRLIQ